MVEGRHDENAVKQAVDAETILTWGFSLSPQTLQQIRLAQQRRGVIVFTDPDFPGEKIRKRIAEAVPGCLHAFLSIEEAEKKGDIGIENAPPEAIVKALEKARAQQATDEEVFTFEDLLAFGLVGNDYANRLRGKIGEYLGIGYTNGKQLLHRLNHYGITREEFLEAFEAAKGGEEVGKYFIPGKDEGDSH